jgi:Fe-S-cluster containining protein
MRTVCEQSVSERPMLCRHKPFTVEDLGVKIASGGG